MTTDWKALCAELADELTQFNAWYIEDNGYGMPDLEALLRRCDAALAERPVRPTDEDLWATGDDDFRANYYPTDAIRYARAILARWGNPAPQPVPVNERLPGPKDCDSEGRCWLGEPQIEDSHDATWNLCTQYDAQEFLTWGAKCGWLPFHALPLPEREVSE